MPTTLPAPPTTQTPPPAGSPPPPRVLRWTADQFNALAATGVFEGKRPFLLDGVIWEQGPMNPPHARALGLLQMVFQPLFTFADGWWIRIQTPLTVDAGNNPFPDFAVVKGSPRDDTPGHPTTAALIIEVADTTLQMDLTEKAERYATANVPEYWVLDLENRCLIVHRDPAPLPKGLGATAYRTQQRFSATERVSPIAVPAASILVGDLLP